MITSKFNLKTSLDIFCFLCRLEGQLLSARAEQRLGLGLERDEPNELNDVENSVIAAGSVFGSFLFLMQRGYLPPLSATGKALLSSLDRTGREIHIYREQAIESGKRDAEADIAISAPESVM